MTTRKIGRFSVASAAGATLFVCASATSARAASILPPNCPKDDACYKEIRIVNNTGRTIYPVVQGSIQTQPALGACPQGDVWLQRALKDTKECYIVKNSYYVYVNPTQGVADGKTASVRLPWWSKLRPDRAPDSDKYVDWWRAGRIYIFDDQTAVKESFDVNSRKGGHRILPDPTGPQVTCMPASKEYANDCKTLEIYRADPKLSPHSVISEQTPFQLNEWTFADVTDPTKGGELLSLNVNYNVSNVDQIYLPVAIEPIRTGYDVGYMGTLAKVTPFRDQLAKFTGANVDQTTATLWPIYNNPIVDQTTKKKRYPTAGIRVPSTLKAFNFYMSPSYVDGNISQPEMIPLPTQPQYIREIVQNWKNCTTAPYNSCPLHDWYTPIKQTFDQSYAAYLKKCWNASSSPAYMAPVGSTGLPKTETYFRFLHGWVPFRAGACTPSQVPDLPLASDPPSALGEAPVNYMKLQYDYLLLNATGAQQFNRYTKLIHQDLGASAYAFSIDDHASFQNFAATGLIFAIGGDKGLPNKNAVPPSVPPFYEWYTAGVSLAAVTQAGSGNGWKSYEVCSGGQVDFPNQMAPDTIGLDPRTTPKPCTITVMDKKNNKYQIKILQFNAKLPMPFQIWPEFTPTGAKPNDPAVVACPLNDDWCKIGINETAHRSDPTKINKAPTFTLGTWGPNK